MMYRYSSFFISVAIFIGIFFTASAQPKAAKPATNNDPEAEKYLKSIRLKLQSIVGYKINFETVITDADQKKQSFKGSYFGSKEKFEMDMPDHKTINDGKTQWVVNKKEKEINISKYIKPKKSKTETPIEIIMNYSTLFKYRVKEPLRNQVVILELIPINKNTSFFKVDLTLNIAKNQIVHAKLYDKGGHRIEFIFTNMMELTKLPTSSFIINLSDYKGYEILDMR